jgi:hypothetical protein
LTKVPKIYIGLKTACSTNGAGIFTRNRKKAESLSHTAIRSIRSRSTIPVQDLKLKPLQERTEKILEHTAISNNFLNRTPVAQQIREGMDCIRPKSFCT